MKRAFLKMLLLITITGASVFSSFAQKQTNETSGTHTNNFANAQLTWAIIDAPNHTYGYDIYADGKTIIHRANFPALPGGEGLKTNADAEKAAHFIIEKVKKGVEHPDATMNELLTLGVLNK